MREQLFQRRKMIGEHSVYLIMKPADEARLTARNFKGVNVPLAGNFFRWTSLSELFADDEVGNHLCAEFLSMIQSKEINRVGSLEIEFLETIGWSSTDDLDHFDPEDLEEFEPNRRSQGKRVRRDRRHIQAPRTKKLTIIFQYKLDDSNPSYVDHVFIVYSLYPGRDIGELDGNVTEREKQVFFDWNHPGE